ncbi:hypothetical protein ACLI4U_05445 [Natrialbaceae archaeon A-CW2]|uniref:hypothetical protein n=1 Tax=Natronosalvus amylolyticus TaxID=2961994 RepID=UPI0020C99D5C|nr:hypothetical protein [Natronosalvus amylolyticus]
MSRPDDVLYRTRVGAFALLRKILPAVLLCFLLIWPMVVFDPPWGALLGWVSFFIGGFVIWIARGIPLYPAHTFGVEHRIDEDTFDGPRKHCTECGTTATQGLRRRYTRQFVVFGIPLHTLEWGINDYCLECARPGGGPGVHETEAVKRVQENDESAERELERAFEG